MWTRRGEGIVESSRYQYKNSYEYAISVINLCIGVNNFFEFPSKVFQYRGGAFIISYAIMILLLGYPVLYLELILGQFHRCSSAIFIRRCVPLLQGFGCLAMISALATLYQHLLSLVRVLKFVISLTMYQWEDLPWSTCGNVWNTDDCYQFYSKQCPNLKEAHILFQNKCVKEDTLKDDEIESAEMQYMKTVVLQNFVSSLSQFSMLDTELAYLWFIIWIVVVLFQIRVGNSFTPFIFVPCIFIFLICPFFFVRSLNLEGAMDGIREMLNVEWAELLYSKIWIEALKMVIESLCIGIGGHTVLASMAKPTKNTFQVATLVIILDSALSLVITATLYCVLGYIRVTTGKVSVHDIRFIPSGSFFAHSMYPVLLREVVNNANLWAVLHYTCMAVATWKSCALIMKTIAVTVADIFNISMKSFKFDILFTLLATFLSFSGLILCFEGGIFYAVMLTSIQRITTGAFITVLMIVVIEFYGLKTIYEDIYILMRRPSKEQWSCFYAWSFWEWRWRMVPAFSMLYVIYQFFHSYPDELNDPMYNYSYDIIQFTVLFLIVVILFASAYYSYLKMLHHFEENERSKHFRFKCLVSPQRHLRSWDWIAKNKKLIEEELPDSEPEDSDGFWKREYLNFFDFSDEANNVKKARRETDFKRPMTEKD